MNPLVKYYPHRKRHRPLVLNKREQSSQAGLLRRSSASVNASICRALIKAFSLPALEEIYNGQRWREEGWRVGKESCLQILPLETTHLMSKCLR